MPKNKWRSLPMCTVKMWSSTWGLGVLKITVVQTTAVAKKRCEKLSSEYFGPYMVLGRVGEVAYLLACQKPLKYTRFSTCSQLKKAVGDHQVQTDISLLNDQMELVLESKNVIQIRWNEAERNWEYLVQWKDQPTHEATWGSYAMLTNQYPNFHLEDKMSLLHGVLWGHQWLTLLKEE